MMMILILIHENLHREEVILLQVEQAVIQVVAVVFPLQFILVLLLPQQIQIIVPINNHLQNQSLILLIFRMMKSKTMTLQVPHHLNEETEEEDRDPIPLPLQVALIPPSLVLLLPPLLVVL